MSLEDSGCGLQTRRDTKVKWFESTFRAKKFSLFALIYLTLSLGVLIKILTLWLFLFFAFEVIFSCYCGFVGFLVMIFQQLRFCGSGDILILLVMLVVRWYDGLVVWCALEFFVGLYDIGLVIWRCSGSAVAVQYQHG